MATNPLIVQALARRVRARRKRAPGQYRAPSFPRQAEASYTRALKGHVRAVAAAVREHVLPVIDRDNDGLANAVPIGDLNRAWAKVRETVEATQADAERAVHDMIGGVNRHNQGSLNREYRRLIGIEPFGERGVRRDSLRQDAPTGVDELLQRRLADNVGLIRSIAPTMIGQVQDVIGEGFREGLRVEDLAKRIEERFAVGTSRAELIARDQTGKLNAQLTEARNREVGANQYVWQVSGAPDGDGRVRDMHLELNGQTFSYDNPPVTNPDGDRNNPGEDYQCRCNALPKLEDVLAALGI